MGFNIGHYREMKADLLSVEDNEDEFLEDPQPQHSVHGNEVGSSKARDVQRTQ